MVVVVDRDAEGLRLVADVNQERGETLKRRRLALGLKSLRMFSEESGIDREALGRAEQGMGSEGTYERAEAWLGRQELENGHEEVGDQPAAIRLTFHDVYGVGELIVEGPVDRPDELTEAVGKLLREIRKGADPA